MHFPQKSIEIAPKQAVGRAIFLLGFRLVLVAVFSVLTGLVLRVAAGWSGAFSPGKQLAGLYMLPVNLLCLWLVSKWMRQEGQPLRESLAPRKKKLARDIGMGLVWQVVLFVPFLLTILFVMWLLYGTGLLRAFETVFYNPSGEVALPAMLLLVLGILTVVTFSPLNAPTEEAVYRGYAQTRLMKKWPIAVSILVSALVFGLQHVVYAATLPGAVVYFAAFAAWGGVAGIVVQYQKRLFPVVVAHFVVNLLTSLPAVVFPVLMLTGVLA